MLAQTETKSKAPFGNSNGRTDKSDGSDPQFVKLKKDLSLASLKNQLSQAKENIAKERAERGSKSRKDDSLDAEVGGKNYIFFFGQRFSRFGHESTLFGQTPSLFGQLRRSDFRQSRYFLAS